MNNFFVLLNAAGHQSGWESAQYQESRCNSKVLEEGSDIPTESDTLQ